MAKQTENDDHNYRSLRNEFDNLQLEEKAVFLVESGFSLLIHSVESLTHFVRDEINKMADGEKEEPEEEKQEQPPPKKAAPKRKPRSSAAKKSTSRSTASKRKPPAKDKKEPPKEDEDSTS